MNILREALDQHPGESHFERALRLVQDKRDLVNSIVARAHLHEEQAAYRRCAERLGNSADDLQPVSRD